jgi:hypothetical protein
MVELTDELLTQLLELIDGLREETQGFLDDPGDQQLWYNRGYANGMVLVLLRLGLSRRLSGREPDDVAGIAAHLPMPWGKAYQHGEQMGARESHQITGTQVS